MSVHYKFKSALSFDTITFDGLHISVRDLKKSILQQKQIGKSTDFDLQITNAQSNEVYEDENVLIPKNSSLIVVRVPLTSQQKKNWEKNETLPVLNNNKLYNSDSQDPFVNRLAKTVDLANVDASEGDKIQAAITQSTLDYDPSNYLRIKGSNQVGELPANYRCYKCMQPGHWIKDCKLNAQQDAIEIKKSTGIPRSFMVPVEGPQVPGAMMTPTGQFAVPTIEHEARREPIRKPLEPALLEKPQIPDDLLCGVCKDLLVDAVLIPCCGNSFCDECIRNVLLESEEHQCPDCKEKDVSPDTLIPNRFLRNSVNNFKNQTGYIRTAHPPTPRQPGVRRPPVTNTSLVTIQVSSPRKASPPVPASPDATEPVITPDDIVLVSEERSRDRDDERRERRQPPLGNAIPELGSEQESLYPPHHRHPLHHHSSRHTTNTNICPQGEDKPHRHKEPPPGYISHQRGDRSGTPTVDERSNERYHQVHTIPPGMEHHQQPPRGPPPHGYHQPRGGNMMYNRGPAFAGNRPPMPPYNNFPPGTGPPPMRGAPPYRGRPRAPFTRDRPSHHNTEILPKGPIDDPLSEFNRIMKEKDAKKQARRHGRSHSRSPLPPLKGGRSYSRSRSPRSRTRSRSPLPLVRRSPRSRSRTRASSRTRSPRSRTPPSLRLRPVRRRSRSRSFTISRSSSRSPRRSRSWASRSPSRDRRERDRDHSPKRRLDYRPASPLRASPPTRYYSKGYKESYSSSGRDSQPSSRNGRGGRFHSSKPVDTFYSTDYSRENERFERGGSGRERERDRFDRYETRDRIERPAERDKDRERDRGEKERDRERERKERFERLDRERERGLPEKEREREREPHREREREKESDRSYAPYKRYDEPTRDYDHPPFRDMAREWEKTRDREIEMREKERQSEYYRKRELKGNPVETIETLREPIGPPGVFEERDRVVIDLPVRSELPEKLRTPEKEKKSKEKKKKKKEDSEKKKKKKRLKEKAEKKEEPLEEGEIVESKSEPDTTTSEKKDDLYGDLGANVDQFVVENYNKPPPSPPVEEQKDTLLEEEKDVMLAPVPELSKWEKEEDNPNLISMKFEDDAGARDAEGKQVTSEILERAMNVITKRNVKPPEKTVEKKEEVKDPVRREREVTKDSEVDKTKERERFREREPEKKRERDLEKSKERESERSREIPREERTRDIPRDERSRDVPREERSRDVPREERSRDVPREERSRDVPREERTRDIPRDERSRDVPREERSRDVPRDERSRDVPREERSRDVPRDERSRDVPREERSRDVPRDERSRDVPRDERSREVPRERSKERERDRERGRDRERERDRGERGRSRDRDRTERERERREREERERHQPRSVALPVKTEPAERKRSSSRSRTSSDTRPRISAKERLGAKVDDQVFVKRDVRVERREVKLEKLTKSMIHKDRDEPVQIKPQRRVIEGKPSDSKSPGKDAPVIQEAKVTSLEELPPDLINPEGDKEEKNVKKRSVSEEKAPEPKKAKVDVEEKGSTEDSSLSSDDSEDRSHKKKKKKKHKKKKKKRRHSSSSDSDSDTSSSPSESEKKKKKHKHKSHKKSKKKKKSKK